MQSFWPGTGFQDLEHFFRRLQAWSWDRQAEHLKPLPFIVYNDNYRSFKSDLLLCSRAPPGLSKASFARCIFRIDYLQITSNGAVDALSHYHFQPDCRGVQVHAATDALSRHPPSLALTFSSLTFPSLALTYSNLTFPSLTLTYSSLILLKETGFRGGRSVHWLESIKI